ncbi:MAG: hypothetical protein ABWZ13_07515 [Acidimicrobiales bacterium]
MSALPRLIALGLLLIAVAVPVAALATEAETESTTTATPSGDEIVPAVEAPPPEAEEEAIPWTTRFLAPATLALGVVGVIAVTIYYGAKVVAKYRVG